MRYNFKILSNKVVYQGFHTIEIVEFQHEKFNGSESPILHRELSKRRSCVGVLPYDPKRKEVILIEQIRLGPLANNEHPWMYEIVAGMTEPNEAKETTMLREAEEEANLKIKKTIPIYEYYMTPGGSCEKISLYCGITDTSNAGGIHGSLNEDEDIKVHVFTLDEALKMLHDGLINNASTIVALQWLQFHADTLAH